MTKQDFLEYTMDFEHRNLVYSKEEIETKIRNTFQGEINTTKIVDFFTGSDVVTFKRGEFTFDLRWFKCVEYWSDINNVVNSIGFILNNSRRIAQLFISEEGRFYNQSHMLIANNEEELFDYLVAFSYDIPTIFTEHTYNILKAAGWHEDRRINIAGFEKKLQLRGIELSDVQRAYFTEFGDLNDLYSDEYWFHSLDRIAEKGEYKEIVVSDGKSIHNVIECIGSMSGEYGIDSDGIIRFHMWNKMGRTTMECINHICENMYTEMITRGKNYGDCELLKKIKKV